ncbi:MULTISPECIES: ABC transporter substrate-binding protein [Brachybacterium]|uniref:Sugar ABC transporter substrate-binding protein n=2 Tax=Brachybacterium TaxID=43668 RepID=A0A426SJP3_9MICO|nr:MULTISPECIES: sugar ABC transporter substrate-binding protein [Brachybacterium]MCT1435888.1 sugar ABC transporter substrate-binding protein [Brachybacterium paraconglomeratum]RRR18407.1 sugar ABC transporter substrate-binding protein [Brachybacterium paraconglomeratum]GLI30040.1 sugar ABC transporter substrate-binding protein [Brachybacterium conglomeratum]GLK04578.1 sugar ABC transporter substrate-binding protein [Brachybacterium conglomeratum]
MLKRRTLLSSFAAAGLLGTAAACSPSGGGDSGSGGEGGGSDAGGSSGGDKGTLTFRLWDENAVAAYEESFATFTEQSGWNVSIDVVPWADYWTRLPLDVASGDAADVYWMNSANYVLYKDSGDLLDINEVVPDGASQWEKAVVDLYSRDGGLWGVPQIWDSIAVFYNKALVEEAGVDPSALAFDPAADTDSLRDAGRKLTVDGEGRHPGEDGFDVDSRAQFGFNSQADRQAIIGPMLASNGAQWQDEDVYTFASPEGIEAFQYMADLINVENIAPSAADTNENGDFTRDLFTQGKLALFQSGPYNLLPVSDGVADSFEWALAAPVAGPDGAKSLVHGVVAVGNAKADDEQQAGIAELLTWLGSKDGQLPLAEQGVSFPGHVDAQDAYIEFWKGKGVDVSVFVEAAKNPAEADTGARANAGLTAAMPIFQEVFIGRLSAADGIPQAQEEGNAAMAE